MRCICEVRLDDSETWLLLVLRWWQSSSCTCLHRPSQALDSVHIQSSVHLQCRHALLPVVMHSRHTPSSVNLQCRQAWSSVGGCNAGTHRYQLLCTAGTCHHLSLCNAGRHVICWDAMQARIVTRCSSQSQNVYLNSETSSLHGKAK